MQSCWMENPLMRPTFEDITKCIKYLLRKVKVCVNCILFTVAVIVSNNPIVFFFFLPFFLFLYICTLIQALPTKISLANLYHVVRNISKTYK